MRFAEFLTSGHFDFTPAEQRLVQALLNDYPTSGLGTASSLAKKAGVSDPTVNRFVVKLGFEGFGAFQARLVEEVEERLRSPLTMLGTNLPDGRENPLHAYLDSAGAALVATRTATPLASFERAARMIMEARGVYLLGGRFSGFISGILAAHLVQFRPAVTALGTPSRSDFDKLVDVGKRDLIIAFDYRRYQRDVIDFVLQSQAKGAQVLLFTDRWQSPAAAVATVTLISPVEVQSPYDTMVPVLAQTEALVAQIVALHGPALRPRIERIETIRNYNEVTEGG